ncbi:hypothetical protein ASPVEDRAFT_28019 [Aspergillus versicolor CBS 583.65]|uniref:Uncharacterized protein n=1 Tax=Aspergillus versicolor CBS 583.65 TaxID=1036611 RepID=A0A1L9PIT5_ASPVE|nr:uncharacterized protein ASPVEDRAFT_28019 [Aspergillus versicolor CBS 583.65]OJJ01355.1 hypothetical protein ASPVEDRAFT_28019 [Aspergillus versicolor CBS 583.65]
MESCNNFTYQVFSLIERHKFNFEVKKANKTYEKRAIPRKLGRGRREHGPDDYMVPYCYNLESRSIRQIKKQWTIGTSLKTFKLANYLKTIWELPQRIKDERAAIKYKVDLLLWSATTIAKRDTECEDLTATRMVRLTEKRKMSMPFMSNGFQLQLEGQVDNVIFAGDEGDLDATLIVFRATKPGRAQVWTLLKLMATIHHARKLAGKDSEIYGIATDSREWAFAHINSKSQYSLWFLSWKYDSPDVVAHVMRIIDYSITRAEAAVRAPSNRPTTGRVTGCKIFDPKELIYSPLEESEEEGYD